jgi:hypothetical protein
LTMTALTSSRLDEISSNKGASINLGPGIIGDRQIVNRD